ncbi:hypothetical protein [Marinobacter nauticus]|uniref:Uncharacterized protein n=1 Tax=Marinobacter nauticus TaxID=2743 RepID=A0A1M2V0W0_MARNT|nr:hypothetical protein [Marinobacter nauticus]OJT01206.1 hypothetical protein BEE62_14740 [Marinobacter nauticus]
MTRHFYSITPSFMRSQGGQPKGVRGATPVRPHFFPELAEVEPKTAEQRRAEYERKRNNIVEVAA